MTPPGRPRSFILNELGNILRHPLSVILLGTMGFSGLGLIFGGQEAIVPAGIVGGTFSVLIIAANFRGK
jgi:hypothetical protein